MLKENKGSKQNFLREYIYIYIYNASKNVMMAFSRLIETSRLICYANQFWFKCIARSH